MGEFNLKIMSAEVFISLQLSYLFMLSFALDLWVGDTDGVHKPLVKAS
jgi:hypothetical protein